MVKLVAGVAQFASRPVSSQPGERLVSPANTNSSSHQALLSLSALFILAGGFNGLAARVLLVIHVATWVSGRWTHDHLVAVGPTIT